MPGIWSGLLIWALASKCAGLADDEVLQTDREMLDGLANELAVRAINRRLRSG